MVIPVTAWKHMHFTVEQVGLQNHSNTRTVRTPRIVLPLIQHRTTHPVLDPILHPVLEHTTCCPYDYPRPIQHNRTTTFHATPRNPYKCGMGHG